MKFTNKIFTNLFREFLGTIHMYFTKYSCVLYIDLVVSYTDDDMVRQKLRL